MRKKHLVYLGFVTATLVSILAFKDQLQELVSRAAPIKASIIVDVRQVGKPIQPIWTHFAQGGEEPPPMLTNTIPLIKVLSPSYIRLDHLYDSYEIVKRIPNGFEYDFSLLDKTVEDILSMGALPFFSLSYMPPIFTKSGSVVDVPTNWNDWKDLVRATIQHYSGRGENNLSEVYYEVWNEPELPQFGSWKLSGEKDYRLLYSHAALGAQEAGNTNKFYLGGPGVGSYYPSWINGFVSYIEQNKLPLDFYSFHRYHKNPNIFESDGQNTRRLLSLFENHAHIPIIITEWGIESENTMIHNENSSAAFTIAALSKMLPYISSAFVFEIKDGPPPGGGKWGLIAHEKSETPLSPKPRYDVFAVLTRMKGNTLPLQGEGTFVKGFATRDSRVIKLIVGNYDRTGENVENVPVTFTGLVPASYQLKSQNVLYKSLSTQEVISTDGTLTKSFIMPANSVLYLELSTNSPLASFISGRSGGPSDQALVLSTGEKLLFQTPGFRLLPTGRITFDMKPLWESTDTTSFIIFDAPFATTSGAINRFFLAKQYKQKLSFLTFGLASNKENASVSIPIESWKKDEWYSVEIGWDQSGLSLSIDNLDTQTTDYTLDLVSGRLLTFYPIQAAIDNLSLSVGEAQLITRNFDGRVDE